ncbi:MAG: helix-turn-helix domain-containing protein [Bacteroidales bacterium]|nr:helix-turn-helix domain-containing protein [Bacteroidales bacterium]
MLKRSFGMTHESLYLLTSFTSALVALVLAVILAGLKIRPSGELLRYGKARWCLAGAFAAYAAFSLLEIMLSRSPKVPTGGLAGSLIIVIGSFMAMFVTMTVLSFIRPEMVNRKVIFLQLAVLVPLATALVVLNLAASQRVFRVCFAAGLAAYLLQLFLYTRLFLKSYRLFNERMLAFYQEEDLVDQLHWINWTFWLALIVGILALFMMLDSLVISSVLTMVFAVCFLIIGISFINYRRFAPMVDRAVSAVPGAPPAPEASAGALAIAGEQQDRLGEWIRQKGYLDNTKAVDDISHELGFWDPTLQDYIRQTTGEDFRSWRIRLRIQEAERIISSDPNIPISQVVAMAGFNDRAFFYRSFQKITGRSVKEFRESLA